MTPRERVRQLSQQYMAKGDFTGWHEEIYANAQRDSSGIPWADLAPNPFLVEWVNAQASNLTGKQALVVGCGLGDDAEYLAKMGMNTTAFDISPTAIAWCKARFPDTTISYVESDVLESVDLWRGKFDLVVEIYTLQVLPAEVRARALPTLAGYVKTDGRLFVFARGREESEPATGVPWPLTRAELSAFHPMGLREVSFEELADGDTRRFRVVYQRG